MNVRELIKELLECDMDDDVEILISKGNSVKVYKVHKSSSENFSNTGVYCTTIEPFEDLKQLDE